MLPIQFSTTGDKSDAENLERTSQNHQLSNSPFPPHTSYFVLSRVPLSQSSRNLSPPTQSHQRGRHSSSRYAQINIHHRDSATSDRRSDHKIERCVDGGKGPVGLTRYVNWAHYVNEHVAGQQETDVACPPHAP